MDFKRELTLHYLYENSPAWYFGTSKKKLFWQDANDYRFQVHFSVILIKISINAAFGFSLPAGWIRLRSDSRCAETKSSLKACRMSR